MRYSRCKNDNRNRPGFRNALAPGLPDLKVLDVHTQVFVENLLNRSVRLDYSDKIIIPTF